MGNPSDAQGRHSGSHYEHPNPAIPVETSEATRRPGSGRTLGMVAGLVVVANIAVAGGLYSIGAWPSQFDGGTVTDDVLPVTLTGSESAASRTVAATVATDIPGYSGPADSAVGAGQVITYPCDVKLPTQPVVGRHRTFNSGGRSVEVTVSAYPTGTGPWVLNETNGQFDQCAGDRDGVSTQQAPEGLGVGATRVAVPAGTAITFRRGDVLVRAFGQPADVEIVSRALDQTLAANMQGCADQVGNLGDERRNPWLAGVPYLGLYVDSVVTTPAKGLPAPPVGVLPVSITAQPPALPEVALPEAPAEPIWPPTLPTAVVKPVPPSQVGPEPISTVVKIPRADTIGPGCGWAFTAAAAPVADRAALSARAAALQNEARTQLRAAQDAWAPAVINYYRQWEVYRKATLRYLQYATAVTKVSTAWQAIQTQRDIYNESLRIYDEAVAARDDFLARQSEAAAEYAAALAVCARPTPTPTPTPTPSGSPATSPTPSPSTTAANCPPERPAILDELPPSVPTRPTPPPDPRPVGQRN